MSALRLSELLRRDVPSDPEITGVTADSRQVASFGSIQNFGGYLAGSVAPIVTGFSIQQSGSFASAFLISAVVAAVAAMAYLLLLKQPISSDK